jgi:nitrogen fixation/metabolism regulation signal transduction histidine kinase
LASTSPVPTPLAGQPRVAPGGRFAAGARPSGRRSRTTDEDLVNQLPVGVVVVDRRYDIQDLNAAARSLLSIRGAAVGEDLLHAVQGIPYAEVRNAIDSAFRDGV